MPGKKQFVVILRKKLSDNSRPNKNQSLQAQYKEFSEHVFLQIHTTNAK